MTSAGLNTSKDYALCYHDMGFSVFVLQNPDSEGRTIQQLKARKKPAVNWELYQIMRPSKIQLDRWFAKNPNYNVGIVTGSISKIVALDVDGPTAGKQVEEARMKMSTNLRIAFDHTMVNKTGSGGAHIIFRVEDDISDISQKKLWTDGKPHSEIKLQGNGHYIVGAPSLHPDGDDKVYQWNGETPALITRQELNELIRLLGGGGSGTVSRLEGNFPPSNFEAPDQRPFTTEEMLRLFKWVKPLYIPGDRDAIILYLSGAMRKDAGFSHEAARTFFKLLC
ncbi:MAG: bifunctional DNA primase/polymerase, partial [Thermoproteota archaeon]|nr:bifunctional DNA primase/polymerase [Thermoproteota archaeon]